MHFQITDACKSLEEIIIEDERDERETDSSSCDRIIHTLNLFDLLEQHSSEKRCRKDFQNQYHVPLRNDNVACSIPVTVREAFTTN